MTKTSKRRTRTHDRGSSPLGLPGAWLPASAGDSGRADAILSWIALGMIAVYAIYWAIQAFTIHRIGNYAVETDFYWKYGPAAAGLKQGRVLIEHFDSKGWGYPLVVAAFSSLRLDLFKAGQLVAVLSASAAAWCVFCIHRRLLGTTLGFLSLLLLIANPTFLTNTYEVGTDMFFFAAVMGSIALLLGKTSPGRYAIAASGLLAGWAFTTRYNGIILWPAAVAALVWILDPRARLKRAMLWSAAFVLAAAPWLYVNWAHTGNPLTNNNYTNVGFAVFGGGDWERFFYGGDRKIHSFADVVLLDPGRFAAVMFSNTFDHLKRDLTELMPLPWGILAAAGLLVVAFTRRTRAWSAYLLFGALYFLTLVPVFYGLRFSLPMLAFYTALAMALFGWDRLTVALHKIERGFPVRVFAFLLLWMPGAVGAYGKAMDPRYPESIHSGPYEIEEAAVYLKSHAPGQTLLARKPHVAFLAGMRFAPMPQVDTPLALHEAALKAGARYLLVSGAEMNLRAAVRPFAEPAAHVPGFRRVFESQGALVYEVLPDSAALR